KDAEQGSRATRRASWRAHRASRQRDYRGRSELGKYNVERACRETCAIEPPERNESLNPGAVSSKEAALLCGAPPGAAATLARLALFLVRKVLSCRRNPTYWL